MLRKLYVTGARTWAKRLGIVLLQAVNTSTASGSGTKAADPSTIASSGSGTEFVLPIRTSRYYDLVNGWKHQILKLQRAQRVLQNCRAQFDEFSLPLVFAISRLEGFILSPSPESSRAFCAGLSRCRDLAACAAGQRLAGAVSNQGTRRRAIDFGDLA